MKRSIANKSVKSTNSVQSVGLANWLNTGSIGRLSAAVCSAAKVMKLSTDVSETCESETVVTNDDGCQNNRPTTERQTLDIAGLVLWYK